MNIQPYRLLRIPTRIIGLCLVGGLLLGIPPGNQSDANAVIGSFGKPTMGYPEFLEGQVVKISGHLVGNDYSVMQEQSYVVKNPQKQEIEIHLTRETRVTGDIEIGDMIIALADEHGVSTSVTEVQKENAGKPPVVRTIVGKVQAVGGNLILIEEDNEKREFVHLDKNSHISDYLKLGDRIKAELGEAGYAVSITILGIGG